MNGRSSQITTYFSWLWKKSQEFLQETHKPDFFRIVDIGQNSAGQPLLKIQVIGKATILECTPHEIAKNDQLIEGFSKKDIRTITYLATQEINKPTCKILFQDFRESINKMIFKLGFSESPNSVEKTADQISLNKELLKKLNAEDAHLVGYTTATEQMLREKEELSKIKLS